MNTPSEKIEVTYPDIYRRNLPSFGLQARMRCVGVYIPGETREIKKADTQGPRLN